MSRFWIKLKLVKAGDILALLFFVLALPCSMVLRRTSPHIWLICESEKEARDNGYCFFRYLRQVQPDVCVVYAIDKKSVDYEKVKQLGRTIQYGSFLHWIYYLAAAYNISTQKSGKPNAAACYLLEVYGILNNTRIFLQHGITISKATWLFYEHTKMRMFICGAKPEYEAIVRDFHYPKGYVQLLGFCRFDELHDFQVRGSQILVMPSWREWLNENTAARKELGYDGNFLHSTYYRCWNGFLESERLAQILEEKKLELIFYPHRDMQRYLKEFRPYSKRITLAGWESYDVQTLLKESALLITDYSSVFMDFSYMHKPILYYQFDVEEFRKGQYEEGYFSYERDGFGEVCFELEDLLDVLQQKCDRNMKLEPFYREKVDAFFTLHDRENCKRTYEAIRKLGDSR